VFGHVVYACAVRHEVCGIRRDAARALGDVARAPSRRAMAARLVARARAATPTTPSTRSRARPRRGDARATRARAKKTWADEQRDDARADARDARDASDANDADARFAYEPRSKTKARPRRRAATGGTTRRARVEVDSPAVDAARGVGEKTPTQVTEEAYVKFLFAYVCAIFVLGVGLGVSAFGWLPEAADGFVSARLYPFFTPFVGGFLVFSSAYGVIKTRNDPNGR